MEKIRELVRTTTDKMLLEMWETSKQDMTNAGIATNAIIEAELEYRKKELHIVQKKTGMPLTLPLPDLVGDCGNFCVNRSIFGTSERNYTKFYAVSLVWFVGQLLTISAMAVRTQPQRTFLCHLLHRIKN